VTPVPDLLDYPCPECGHDGPHPVTEGDTRCGTAECGDCVIEFEFTSAAEDDQ
jgi:hypothetical protein